MFAPQLLLAPTCHAAFVVMVVSCWAASASAAVTSLGSVNPVPPVGGGTFTANLIVGDEQASSSDTRAWLNIDGGTALQYSTLIVGDDEGFVGTVNVFGNWLNGVNTSLIFSGQGSSSSPTVRIGNEGTGYLNVRGGTMTLASVFADMSIGDKPTGIGYVTVSDPFTQFTLSDDLVVGRTGMGTLEILNGATFQTTSTSANHAVTIGSAAMGIGNMVVDGLGTVFHAGSKLYVGGDGNDTDGEGVGNLTIGSQAIIDVDNSTSAAVIVGPLGRVNLDGGILIGPSPTPVNGFGTTVSGILGGSGVVRGTVGFNASSSLEVGPGDLLDFNSIVSNQGTATISHGEVRFQKEFTNNAQGIFAAPGRISLENGTVRFAQLLTTNAGVIVSSEGTNNVHGAINNAGRVVVASDTVAVFHDTFTNPLTVEVLPRGNALFLSNMYFTGTSVLEMGVGMTGTTDTSGQISVSGAVTLGGSLAIDVHGGFTPTLGQSFDLITAGGLSGEFSSVTVPDIPGTLEYLVVYDPTSVRLVVADEIGSAMASDFNGDLTVDAADYISWRKGLGTIFTQDDYNDWRAHFGQTAVGGTSFAVPSAVPEPLSAMLLLLAFGRLHSMRTARPARRI